MSDETRKAAIKAQSTLGQIVNEVRNGTPLGIAASISIIQQLANRDGLDQVMAVSQKWRDRIASIISVMEQWASEDAGEDKPCGNAE